MLNVNSFKSVTKATKALPRLEKGMFKSIKPLFVESPSRKALRGANNFLRNTGAKVEMELPVDQFLKEIPEAQRKAVADILGNPETVQLKAKHNKNGRFSILGFLAKKGDKTVGKGALSITDFGTPNAVLKYRVSTGNKGQNLAVSAFADCAKTATPEQISTVHRLTNKTIGGDVRVGDALGAHVDGNISKLLKLLPKNKTFEVSNLLDKIKKLNIDQSAIDKVMEQIQKLIGALG